VNNIQINCEPDLRYTWYTSL